jgi:hypothetical protein
MKINNTKIYGLDESIKASGYPKSLNTNLTAEINNLKDHHRAKKLGNARIGSGHDCMLKGIIVQADFTAPQHFWLQWGRYHFNDIISSQSKMHMLEKFDLSKQCTKYVDPIIKARIYDLQQYYLENMDNESFRILLDSIPSGFLLTARITTNYLQLKTMYFQRKRHKLEEWSVDFVNWCQSLPKFQELCLEKDF